MKNPKHKVPLIGVIGGNTCSEEEYALAEEVGRFISRAGAYLICGGMSGIMEAACKGAAEAGGVTIGILPTEDVSAANPYVKIPIATGMGIGRNIIIVRTASSLIAINGKYGTLSEIAFALQLSKPVVALSPWLDVPGIVTVHTAEEAVNLALQLAK
ncbi:MAG: TIGR00725 family protein [Calditrichia bacterium]